MYNLSKLHFAPQLVDVANVGSVTGGNACDGLHGSGRRANLLPLSHSGDEHLQKQFANHCKLSTRLFDYKEKQIIKTSNWSGVHVIYLVQAHVTRPHYVHIID
jgi:hypothetical protein